MAQATTPAVEAALECAPDLIDAIEAELAERHFADFVRRAWRIVEPTTPISWNWHIDLICEHLEAVTAGEIQDLVINMPPRHMKSTLVSVMWPAWAWIAAPSLRWIFASYADSLATRDSIKCRRIIKSPWYDARWGDRYQLTSDQNVKTRFENDATGYRLATSVGGSVTGEGGDVLVVDDPHNIKQIHSDAIRKSVIGWWDEVMSSRRNDPGSSSRVIVMQRGHHEDLSGHVLARDDYVHLEIQSLGERKTVVQFPRSGRTIERDEGDLLWPDRFGPKAIADAKRELGKWGFAAQHQQRPTPRGGGLIKREWWKYYDALPTKLIEGEKGEELEVIDCENKIQSWDTAFKKGQENDYSVCTTWARCGDAFYLLDLWRKRVEFPELKRAAVNQYDKHMPWAVLIEDKASGQSLVQSMKRDTGLPIQAIPVDTDKIARVNAVSPAIESGRVLLPERAPWLADFLDEFEAFPNGAHDDIVDSCSQALMALLKLLKKRLARPRFRSLG